MNIDDYICRLSVVKDIAHDLSEEIESGVAICFCETYWEIICFDKETEEDKYKYEFDNLDSLVAHLSAMYCGARLANGREV
jgi:hypothetical protein